MLLSHTLTTRGRHVASLGKFHPVVQEENDDDDDEFRFNDASTHEGHLRQNGKLTWFCNETITMISHKKNGYQIEK